MKFVSFLSLLALCGFLCLAEASPRLVTLDGDDDDHGVVNGTAAADAECAKPSSAEAWGAALGFTALISIVSVVGVLVIPALTTRRSRSLVIPFLVAFGAGSMLTTAVTVLLPEAYGLHAHGGEDGHDDHAGEEVAGGEGAHADEEESEDGKLYLKRGAVALAGAAFFFLLQQVFRHSHDHAHHMVDFDDTDAMVRHSHGHAHGGKGKKKRSKSASSPASGARARSSSSDSSGAFADDGGFEESSTDGYGSSSSYSSSSSFTESETYSLDGGVVGGSHDSGRGRRGSHADRGLGPNAGAIADRDVESGKGDDGTTTHEHLHGIGAFIDDVGLKHKSAGWVNLASDAIHNLTDGLIIGAIFTQSTSRGIAVVVPILVHELAQEFGDFAFLIHSGFSRTQAIGFNVLSGVIAMVGALAGLAIGETTEKATPWIAAFAAGGFLFVSLTLMLPEMMHIRGSHMTLVNQSAAFVLGCIVTFFIVFYIDEDLIRDGEC